ncbi:MAG: carbohydrate ABC transporter permease [Leucobacter sp.]
MAFVALPSPARGLDPSRPATHRSAAPVARASADAPVGSRSRVGFIVGNAVLAALALFSIFPVYWMFATSLRAPEDALSQQLLPWPISFENFAYVWETIAFDRMLVNTFLMATVLSLAQLFIAILAAYAFAMWSFPGRRLLMFLFIGSWLVPFQVTMIPNYLLISQLGLLETVAGVVVPQLSAAFAVLLMVQHMRSFPRELLDAAKIDGRSGWSTLWRIVVPNMKPALAALAIMGFISAWNEYLWPTIVMRQSNDLVQIGVRSFLGQEGNNWGATMAAAGLATIPVLLIYIFLQRYVVDAFVRSGLK